MATYFTADPHFGHAQIISFCNRPFERVDDMDSRILRAYQETVRTGDDLWILGDFAFAREDRKDRVSSLLSSIPGRKHLVAGNHDPDWVRALPEWASVHDLVEIKDGKDRVTLCHYPMITFPGARHGAIQLFGHVHDNWEGSRNSVNVGVDVWGFAPVTLEQVKRRAARLPNNPLWSSVEPRSRL